MLRPKIMWPRVALLSCGIVASVLYVAMTLFVGMLWDGYSIISGVPSELSAIGAPTRTLWITLGIVYGVLMIAFGWIVWSSAPPNRALRTVGALLMAHTAFGQFWPPMHQRAVLAAGGGTLSDTLHLVWAAVTVVLFILIVGFGAAALGNRFRLYSIATMVIVLACGAVTGTYASAIQADLPTPWVGVWERISIAAFMAWIAVLAIALLRARRDDRAAGRALLAGVERHVISTRWGKVEYAERGSGKPVLVVHGIFHNGAGALLSVREFSDRRVIAPCRFGYRGSSMPPRATPADQADAFAALLDALAIDQIDVIAESAGATSALQLALRHPGRVTHLAVLVGNLPGSPTAVVQPSLAKLVNRQLPLWVLWRVAPSMLIRTVAAVPKEFAMSSADVRDVTEFIDSLFPISAAGVDFDAFVSNAAVNDCNLEAIDVPTLIIHTKDDQLASHEASQRAAQRIPGARFVSLASGGHLMIGQMKTVRDEVVRFFDERRERRAAPLAS